METPNYLIQNIPRLALNSKGLPEGFRVRGVPLQLTTLVWLLNPTVGGVSGLPAS